MSAKAHRIFLLVALIAPAALAQQPFNPPSPPPRQPATVLSSGVSSVGPGVGPTFVGGGTVVSAAFIDAGIRGYAFTGPSNLIQIRPGLISGGQAGVVFVDPGELDNSSKIRSDNVGVDFRSTAFVFNNPTGIIDAPTAIRVTGGSAYLLNRGTISGSVQLDDFRNSVQLFTGSTISGDLELGASRNSQLVLSGTGLADYSEAVGGETKLAGYLFKTDGGTWVVDRPLTVGRSTAVLTGSLVVNETLRSPTVNVDRGGALSGTGRIIGNLINSGLVGTSSAVPGTFRVAGNFTQTASGTLLTRLASLSSHDRLAVSGRSSLDGTLSLSLLNGFVPQAGDRFVILTSKQGISGEFAAVEQPISSDLQIRYGDRRVVLVRVGPPAPPGAPPSPITPITPTGPLPPVSPTTPVVPTPPANAAFAGAADTSNQLSVARALDRLALAPSGDATDVITELRTFSDPGLRAAFDEISPRLYTALPTIAFTLVNAQDALFTDRFAALRSGRRGFQAQGQPIADSQVADRGKAVVDKEVATKQSLNFDPHPDNPWGAFLTGSGTFAKANGIADLPDYRFDTGTITLGIDRRFGPATFGVFSGYSGTRARFDDGSGLDLNSARFGLYGTYEQGGFYLNSLVSGATHSYRVRRDIDFGDVDRTARSRPEGGEFHSLIGGGYDYRVGPWTLGVITSLQYTYLGIGAFAEDGADTLDTRIEDQSANSLRSSLGARVAYTAQISPSVTLTPEVRAEWQHEFLGYAPVLHASLDGGSGPGFDVDGDDQARNTLLAAAGLTATFGDRIAATAFYHPDFGGGSVTAHTIAASLGINF